MFTEEQIAELPEPVGGLYQFGPPSCWWHFTPTYKPAEEFDTEPGQVVRSIPVFTHSPDSAARIKELQLALAAQKSEWEKAYEIAMLRQQEVATIKEKLRVARASIKRISEQTPEKPDYWSSCSQCEHNASDCEEALATIGEDTP